jgi:pimeloyl-ACP methyl ester carboxylesterase
MVEGQMTMPTNTTDMGAISAPTQFVETTLERYAYRRFGQGTAPPLVFLQHFTGTLDNWDPAVADALAQGREVTCSRVPAWDVQAARYLPQSPEWPRTLRRFWTHSA